MDQVDNLNLKSSKAKEEDKIEVTMIDTVMISEVNKIDIGQIVETGDNIDKIEVNQGMKKIIEVEILEVRQGHIKILRDKAIEESTEIITEMKVIAEVGMGMSLEKDHFLETLVMIETIGAQAIVGPDQYQGLAQIETESDVTSLGNIIILQRIVLPPEKKEN